MIEFGVATEARDAIRMIDHVLTRRLDPSVPVSEHQIERALERIEPGLAKYLWIMERAKAQPMAIAECCAPCTQLSAASKRRSPASSWRRCAALAASHEGRLICAMFTQRYPAAAIADQKRIDLVPWQHRGRRSVIIAELVPARTLRQCLRSPAPATCRYECYGRVPPWFAGGREDAPSARLDPDATTNGRTAHERPRGLHPVHHLASRRHHMNTTTDRNLLLSTGSLTGTKIVNLDGEDLGTLDEIMLHADSGDVAYAVVSFGGFLGMGDKLFAVPWDALTVDTDEHRLVLDVDRERLENAPGFDKDAWPTTADDTWMNDLHEHYGSTYQPRSASRHDRADTPFAPLRKR